MRLQFPQSKGSSVFCALFLVALFSTAKARGQVFVTDWLGGTVGEYSLTGVFVICVDSPLAMS